MHTDCIVESLLRPGKGPDMSRTNIITQDTQVEAKQIEDSPFAHIISKTTMTQRPNQEVSEYLPWTYNHPMGTIPWYIPQHGMFMRKRKSPRKMSRQGAVPETYW